MILNKRSIYSVWNDAEKNYAYYEASDTGPATNQLSGPHPYLGAPPEDAAVRVPLYAKYVGSGDDAIGRVAEHGVNFRSLVRYAAFGLAVYGAYRLWKG